MKRFHAGIDDVFVLTASYLAHEADGQLGGVNVDPLKEAEDLGMLLAGPTYPRVRSFGMLGTDNESFIEAAQKLTKTTLILNVCDGSSRRSQLSDFIWISCGQALRLSVIYCPDLYASEPSIDDVSRRHIAQYGGRVFGDPIEVAPQAISEHCSYGSDLVVQSPLPVICGKQQLEPTDAALVHALDAPNVERLFQRCGVRHARAMEGECAWVEVGMFVSRYRLAIARRLARIMLESAGRRARDPVVRAMVKAGLVRVLPPDNWDTQTLELATS